MGNSFEQDLEDPYMAGWEAAMTHAFKGTWKKSEEYLIYLEICMDINALFEWERGWRDWTKQNLQKQFRYQLADIQKETFAYLSLPNS